VPNIRLSEAISEFNTYASVSYARGTVRCQRSALDKFLTETGNLWMKNITTTHVDRFAAGRQAQGIHPHSIRNDIGHLRVFFTWARQRKYIPVNSDPVGSRRTPRVIPHSWTIIGVEEFPRILDNARNPRDRAIIAFGIYTMCRQGEAGAVRIEDLDLESGWVVLRVQKSGILDRMPISAELSAEMARWLQVYEAHAGPLDPHWKLFPALEALGHGRDEQGRLTKVPKGMLRIIPDRSPTKIHVIVQHALRACGYPSNKEGMHTLRRSAARARFDQLVADGYDGALREIQVLLHHQNTVTTERYLGVTIEVRGRNEAIRGRRMFGSQQAKGLRVANA